MASQAERSIQSARAVRVLITLAATALLLLHLFKPELGIDYLAAVLIVIAALPWLPLILHSAKLPGGWELTFRAIENQVQGQEAELDRQRRRLDKQQEIVNQLVVFSMAFFLLDRLKGLYYAKQSGSDYIFHKSDDAIKDFRYLRDNGYIEIIGIGQFQDGQDIAPAVKLTPIGEYYVRLREEYEMKRQATVNT